MQKNMRIVLLILVPPILLFGFALVMMRLPLPQPFPPSLSGGRNRMVAVMTGVLGLGYIVGLAVYLISSFLQAGRVLDPAFTSRGLTSESYMAWGRQYQGLVQGRQVTVQFTPPQGLQPALLNMYVTANLDERMAVGEQRPLLDCRDCQRIDVNELGLSHLQVFAEEAAWARALLAESENRATLNRLLSSQKEHGLREVYIQPGRIWLRARPSSSVTESRGGEWLDDLLALAEAAEG
jgi:hypothetical protein